MFGIKFWTYRHILTKNKGKVNGQYWVFGISVVAFKRCKYLKEITGRIICCYLARWKQIMHGKKNLAMKKVPILTKGVGRDKRCRSWQRALVVAKDTGRGRRNVPKGEKDEIRNRNLRVKNHKPIELWWKSYKSP